MPPDDLHGPLWVKRTTPPDPCPACAEKDAEIARLRADLATAREERRREEWLRCKFARELGEEEDRAAGLEAEVEALRKRLAVGELGR